MGPKKVGRFAVVLISLVPAVFAVDDGLPPFPTYDPHWESSADRSVDERMAARIKAVNLALALIYQETGPKGDDFTEHSSRYQLLKVLALPGNEKVTLQMAIDVQNRRLEEERVQLGWDYPGSHIRPQIQQDEQRLQVVQDALAMLTSGAPTVAAKGSATTGSSARTPSSSP